MSVRSWLTLLALAVVLALSTARPAPPVPLPAGAPITEFSAERARTELAVVAARPHPTGSSADDEVRDTLVKRLRVLGFDVEVEDTISATDAYARRWGISIVAARVRNVIARRRGTAGGSALLLMAHYDSRELAPGASDDGYGVATLLETARALSASPPLRHDVVLLLTEGEEQGLLGARAFFAESPAAKDVGLVLNFEARGDAGPALMFQTSEHAAALVDVLARAAPYVAATSISQEVYRRMPNDTDLTVALQAGYAAMNFANVGGFARYHRATDTVANASLSTLQHHGSYALALARAFGNAEPMVPASRGDEVFFNLGPWFIHYGERAALPLAIGTLLILAGAFAVTGRRDPFRLRAVWLVALVVFAPISAMIVAMGVAAVTTRICGRPLGMQELREGTKTLYDGGFALLGGGVSWAVLAGFGRREPPRDLAVACALLWGGLAVASAVFLPGGSYLFAWPLAAAVVVAVASFGPLDPAGLTGDVGLFLVPTVAFFLLVPVGTQLGVTFGPPAAPLLATLAAFSVTSAIPLLVRRAGGSKWWLPPSLIAGAGVGCASIACALPQFDASSPEPDSLIYAADADLGTTSWLSTDDAPDAWTSRVLGDAVASRAEDFFPRATNRMLRASAETVAIDPPRLVMTSDTRGGATPSLRLRLFAPPGAEVVTLSVPPSAGITSASVAGKAFSTEPDEGWVDLIFFGPPPEGIEVAFETRANAVAVRVVAQMRGLPPALAAGLGSRPPDRMPAVGWNVLRASDMTLVGATFKL